MARVMLIEDEANLRRLYRLELGREGYDVIDANSEADALRKLGREKIDAVVLDLRLWDHWGIDLLDEILARRRDVPIIINTAYSQWRNDFHLWGADAFVTKSSDLTELKQALAHALERRN
ncbi:MAG: response regulator [candidate division KSB1 bacterium]|nr:response regulator [candidate division KSB1 bacterium]MDZ7276306.1 response regulator [candidate division KSB1 bacterium]MDZ7287741.1 response regulator [candidate division KSB1 bacterium]MDZ7299919.1 response regulator [candidate division KSB1 bacterium]MDZ7308379.1 response regulator [candidate division KSB1 bacterium]